MAESGSFLTFDLGAESGRAVLGSLKSDKIALEEIHRFANEPQRILDDLFGGIIAGLLIYRYEYSRSKYLNERLKTIELMNHHVRNALNVIVASVYVHGHNKQLNEIQISVNRIDWALREVLPGRVLDDYSEIAAEKDPPHSAA